MEKKERDKIIRECAKEIFEPEGFLFSASKRSMADDNGYFLTCVDVEPCNVGGIFITVYVYFLWYGSTNIIHHSFYDYKDRYGRYDSRITYLGKNSFMEQCLLYEENDSPEDFCNDVHMFMTNALKVALSYRRKADISTMYSALWNWKNPLRPDDNYKNSDFDIAMITALNNKAEKAKEILDRIIQSMNDRTQEQYRHMVLEYNQALAESNDKFLRVLNKHIKDLRQKCQTKYKKIDLSKHNFISMPK